MKKLPILIAAILALTASNSFALTPQQEKMKGCNADAKTKSLKGDERKSFMKECLSAKGADTPATTLTPQQEKMKTCNADAKTQGKKGAERKTFMSTCLSGTAAAAAPAAATAPPAAAPAAATPAAPAAH